MNNFQKDTDEEVIDALHELSKTVQPSAELLHTTLKKISLQELPAVSPKQLVVSPIRLSPFSAVSHPFWKAGIAVVALVVVIGGASFTFVNYSHAPSAPVANSIPTTMSNPNDTSDAALDQDTSVIDSELQSLDSDESGTDQALMYNPST